ncbi:hypothetical protein THRCLA_04316 [Thraustotheca clavata]|uniref:Uncharacterized protein n=1 Tax=Thraustotheca clavata TaxID=74557 RepID=A0A1V9ZZD7_9STRA|nr:hypothetical protein THRCLA_04316 [Thraustotheca clavata]
MNSTSAAVVKDLDLFKNICQYQKGLPLELKQVIDLAKSIIITPCYIFSSARPTAYLSNIPSCIKYTPYLQLFKYWDELPNYALFLSNHKKEPTLPFHLSIAENNIKHVKMWIKYKPEWLTPAPLKLAAICGHLEIVEILMSASKNVCCPEAMDLAAMNGYLDVVKFMHNKNGPGCTTEAMDGAATFGHLEVVQFLNDNRTEGSTPKALQGAVYMGYGTIVEYLFNHGHQHFRRSICFFCPEYYRIQCHRAAKEKDYVGVLQSLIRRPLRELDDEIILAAIKNDPYRTIMYLHQHKVYTITKILFDDLVETKNKQAIRYALEVLLTENKKPISLLDGSDDVVIDPWSPKGVAHVIYRSPWLEKEWSKSKAMDIAAALGDLDTIKLLHRSGIKCCTVDAMNKAAAIGRIDIAEWLHIHRTEGCSENAITYAIAGKHFDMVKWLHEVRGVNCTMDGLSTAAYMGDLEMVKYLISISRITANYFPRYTNGGNKKDFMPGNVRAIEIFCGRAVDRAASNGHIDIVKMLHDHSATTKAMDDAVSNGHIGMVRYLQTYRKEGCSTDAYSSAIKTNRFDIFKYLVTNDCGRGVADYEKLCIETAGCNNIDMLEFCMKQLHKDDITTSFKQQMMYKAAMYGQLENVKFLHEVKGFKWTYTIQQIAVSRENMDVANYLDSVDGYEENVLNTRMLWSM